MSWIRWPCFYFLERPMRGEAVHPASGPGDRGHRVVDRCFGPSRALTRSVAESEPAHRWQDSSRYRVVIHDGRTDTHDCEDVARQHGVSFHRLATGLARV